MFITKTFEVRDKMTFIPALGTRIYGHVIDVLSKLPVAESGIRAETPEDWSTSSTGGPRWRVRDCYLARRAGFGDPLILFTRLTDAEGHWDPQEWRNRTMKVAHEYVAEHWDELESGALIDVEFILGERPEPKRSEKEEVYE